MDGSILNPKPEEPFIHEQSPGILDVFGNQPKRSLTLDVPTFEDSGISTMTTAIEDKNISTVTTTIVVPEPEVVTSSSTSTCTVTFRINHSSPPKHRARGRTFGDVFLPDSRPRGRTAGDALIQTTEPRGALTRSRTTFDAPSDNGGLRRSPRTKIPRLNSINEKVIYKLDENGLPTFAGITFFTPPLPPKMKKAKAVKTAVSTPKVKNSRVVKTVASSTPKAQKPRATKTVPAVPCLMEPRAPTKRTTRNSNKK